MAKQISLREFQANLSARLSSAARGQAVQSLLGVRAGGKHWLLSLEEAGEVLPPPSLTSVPLTQPWFVGMANIRGTLYSVADFSAYQGNTPAPKNEHNRLLLIGARMGSNAALLVERVLGLRSLEKLTPIPSTPVATPWMGECYSDEQGQEWTRLNITQLLTEPSFINIGL